MRCREYPPPPPADDENNMSHPDICLTLTCIQEIEASTWTNLTQATPSPYPTSPQPPRLPISASSPRSIAHGDIVPCLGTTPGRFFKIHDSGLEYISERRACQDRRRHTLRSCAPRAPVPTPRSSKLLLRENEVGVLQAYIVRAFWLFVNIVGRYVALR